MSMSEVQICNIALSWLGGERITSFNDGTTEANLCQLNYDASRDATLEARDWTFAMCRSIPNKLADVPEFGYDAAFQLPPDFIRVVQISKLASMHDKVEDWVKEGDKIYVNADAIFMRYIKRCSDPTQFSASFIQALATRLAADMAVPLTNNVELFANYWDAYLSKVEEAGAYDGMQGVNQRLRSRYLTRVR